MTAVDAIARAVLYEGYCLYPYRSSAAKNRRRVLFGTLMPGAWADAEGAGESGMAATEVVLVGTNDDATVAASLRFLRLGDAPREVVIDLPKARIADLARARAERTFDVEGIACLVTISATRVRSGVHRLRAVVENTSALASGAARDRAEELAMGALHIVLVAEGACWTSQIDPPADVADVAMACRQQGLYPVLVGAEGTSSTVLASPIILYDHPKVAVESAGDLFDATEIEEILSLRIQTLTDAEKSELRASDDPRIRALLERIEALGPESLARLHGALREPRRAAGFVVGERVRLRPSARADALDIVLSGLAATVVSVEHTFEGQELLCVTIDSDPGKDLGAHGFPGHRFFFRPDEMERLA